MYVVIEYNCFEEKHSLIKPYHCRNKAICYGVPVLFVDDFIKTLINCTIKAATATPQHPLE